MIYHDLRDFIAQLEKMGELKRISMPVSPHLEMTEICDRVLRQGGPAILMKIPRVLMARIAYPFWATYSVPCGAWRWAWARMSPRKPKPWPNCAK